MLCLICWPVFLRMLRILWMKQDTTALHRSENGVPLVFRKLYGRYWIEGRYLLSMVLVCQP